MVRDDGSEVALQPNYNNTEIECYVPDGQRDHKIPRIGLGGTSGPGTFKYFKNKKVQ